MDRLNGANPTAAGGRRRSARASETRERIVAAAAQLLATKGYGATSLDEVAEVAGLTKGTVYYHFDSKEDLYKAVVYPQVTSATEQAIGILDDHDDPREALEMLLAAIIRRARDPSQKYLYYQEMLPLSEETRRAIRYAERSYEARVAEVIRAGQERGQFIDGDPKVIALVVIGTVARTARWYDPHGSVGPEEFSRTLLSLLLHGVEGEVRRDSTPAMTTHARSEGREPNQ